MRILLTNDDGYHARGLALLEALARTISDDITVIAPADEQSGKGRSLSLTEPFRVRRHAENRYAVHGTPTDCVMFALAEAMKDNKPDLILSGINRGGNLAEDVSYSGTVSAAMEGALAGIRSVALSQRYARTGAGDKVSFAAAEAWGERALHPLLAMEWAPRTLVNINFPPVAPDAVEGIRVVSQGLRDYGRVGVERRTDPRGFDYYWLAMGSSPQTPGADTDLEAIERGYVTVTPLQLDLTHRDSLDRLKSVYS
ncbi:5'/3'-nucleotidase SurE [Sphingomonas sp. S2-65]|uniref:5'/3'-nucleotidase SurE n=1 Tax=Sphingomonas sp. S2-65 TaxID=2903960 RepID=UPI001F44639C|nr:5'/3'-nucleotidase SurE [Sphingomonas sp. S2-65]UYY58834.1 5'/3'-nucleotidase SurE [Sphingomonas sp. S2-65]